MNLPYPTSEERDAAILAAYHDGLGRNAIAKLVGVSGSIVSRVVKQAGGTFDRTKTKAATAARVVDTQERRMELAQTILTEAERQATALAKLPDTGDERSLDSRSRVLTSLARALETTNRAMPITVQDANSAVDAWLATLLPDERTNDL